MSRGGRGGKYQGGRPRGIETPFDIDPELLKAVDEAADSRRESKEDFSKELYPDLAEYIAAAPITDAERRGVKLERLILAKRRAGPFWTGGRIEWTADDASPTEADGFTDVETYSRKRKKAPFRPADFKRVKVCYQQYFPKELQDLIIDTNGAQPERKKTNGLSKSAIDTMAKAVEDDKDPEDDITPTDDPKVVNSDDENDEEEGVVDILDDEPQDDEFEDDDDNDYNAEKYFDGGESDYDSGAGGDDGGGDGDDDY